jgi:ribose transport system substrate-binding protein
MRRKLFIVLALLALVVLAIAACQPAAPEEEAAEEEPAGEEMAGEEADDEIFIGMVQHSSIPFTQQMRAGFDAACEDFPIECEYNAPETVNPETAIGMFEAMVQKGADAIVLNAAPPEAWETVVGDAVEQGVLVNAIDNFPPAETGFGVFVSPSNEATAYALANEFFDQLRSQGMESGEVVWGICAPGYVGQEERADGWQRACDDQDDFTCVGRLDTGHNVELDYAFWETTVLQYPDAVGFAGNCAFDGPNLARLKIETGGDWGIATFDLEPETLVGIQDGTITVAMGINPWLNAYLATRLAYEHLVSGEPISQGQIDSGPELVTADNVDAFLEREDDLELKHDWHLDLIDEMFSDLDSLIQPFSE